MDRRALLAQAREMHARAGVYRIRNTRTGRVWVQATRNLKTIEGQRFQLETGGHRDAALQAEWRAYGADAFAFEVLEVLERPETGYFDEVGALKRLRAKWQQGDHPPR